MVGECKSRYHIRKGSKNSDQQLSDDCGHNRRYDYFLYDVSDGVKGNYFTGKIS